MSKNNFDVIEKFGRIKRFEADNVVDAVELGEPPEAVLLLRFQDGTVRLCHYDAPDNCWVMGWKDFDSDSIESQLKNALEMI